MSVKYILSSSSGEAAPYLGALDLGGASTQITFDPEGGVILGNAYRVTADGEPYRLYSHSYMLSGQNEAQARHVKATLYDPSSPARATGSTSALARRKARPPENGRTALSGRPSPPPRRALEPRTGTPSGAISRQLRRRRAQLKGAYPCTRWLRRTILASPSRDSTPK